MTGLKIDDVRPELIEFVIELEEMMRKHDDTKGDTYKIVEIPYLWWKKEEEFLEVYDAWHKPADKRDNEQVLKELIDDSLMNALLIWRLKRVKQQ